MKHVTAIVFVLIATALVIGNMAAVSGWIFGSPLNATLVNIVIIVDILIVVSVLLAGAAFAVVFIYAMSKDAS